MSALNGGPAFPKYALEYNYGTEERELVASSPGMSLRDYFAAHAPEVPDMQIFPINHGDSWAAHSARWAIEYADAMLAERAK